MAVTAAQVSKAYGKAAGALEAIMDDDDATIVQRFQASPTRMRPPTPLKISLDTVSSVTVFWGDIADEVSIKKRKRTMVPYSQRGPGHRYYDASESQVLHEALAK